MPMNNNRPVHLLPASTELLDQAMVIGPQMTSIIPLVLIMDGCATNRKQSGHPHQKAACCTITLREEARGGPMVRQVLDHGRRELHPNQAL